jgi:hypothetical protein
LKDPTEKLHLDPDTVKPLGKQYMRALPARTATPCPTRRSAADSPGRDARVEDRSFIKGQRHALPSHREDRAPADNWRMSRKWQRLARYEKFAETIDRHGDGIAACSEPENKVSLRFVEALDNRIRVIRRRAYGLRLRLKILTCMLPNLQGARIHPLDFLKSLCSNGFLCSGPR